jgi:hypothetical protein
MHHLNELREQGRITWIDEEHGWVAAPQEIVDALSNDGFAECKRETSRRRGADGGRHLRHPASDPRRAGQAIIDRAMHDCVLEDAILREAFELGAGAALVAIAEEISLRVETRKLERDGS